MHSSRTNYRSIQKQRGAAFMVMLVIMIIGVAAMFVASLNSSAIQIARNQATADALAKAKEALIAYAISDTNRPGELPCPDFNNDGMITLNDYSGSNCKSLVGWLPWKTLGLPELFDANGDHLWYAVANPFHANSSAILNSDTPITLATQMLTVQDGVTGATLESNVIAVIFSSGVVLTGEARSPNDNNAVIAIQNYLEGSNAIPASIVFQTSNGTTINDRLLTINYATLFPSVELRIAREAKACLDNYAATSANKYPWAVPVSDTTSYLSASNTYFGRLSITMPATSNTADPFMSSTWPSSCTLFASSYWPSWQNLVFYQVANGYQPGGTPSCTPNVTCLTISGSGNTAAGNGNYRAAVLVARRALGTQDRTNPATNPPIGYLANNPVEFSSDPAFKTNAHDSTSSSPSAFFITYKPSDLYYQSVNDLVLCLDGINNCK